MKINLQSRCWQLLILCILALSNTACSATPTSSQAPAQHIQTATPIRQVTPTPISSGQPLLTGPVTYVAMGASDAVGVGSSQPGAQGYVPLLAQKLPQGSHLINLGVSGIHLHQALSDELPLALSTAPKLITIWLVANDFIANVSYDSYMQDLNILLKQLRAGTQARIVIANLPNLTLLPAFAGLNVQQKATTLTTIKRWNSHIAELAAQYGITEVDLLAQESLLTSHPEYVSADGFHPSAAGYVQLANFFWQAIKQ